MAENDIVLRIGADTQDAEETLNTLATHLNALENRLRAAENALNNLNERVGDLLKGVEKADSLSGALLRTITGKIIGVISREAAAGRATIPASAIFSTTTRSDGKKNDGFLI